MQSKEAQNHLDRSCYTRLSAAVGHIQIELFDQNFVFSNMRQTESVVRRNKRRASRVKEPRSTTVTLGAGPASDGKPSKTTETIIRSVENPMIWSSEHHLHSSADESRLFQPMLFDVQPELTLSLTIQQFWWTQTIHSVILWVFTFCLSFRSAQDAKRTKAIFGYSRFGRIVRLNAYVRCWLAEGDAVGAWPAQEMTTKWGQTTCVIWWKAWSKSPNF